MLVICVRPTAVGSGRDDRFCAGLQDGVVKVFSIVGPVGDDEAARDPFDQGSAKKNFAALARTGKQAGGIAEAVGGDVQLGA